MQHPWTFGPALRRHEADARAVGPAALQVEVLLEHHPQAMCWARAQLKYARASHLAVMMPSSLDVHRFDFSSIFAVYLVQALVIPSFGVASPSDQSCAVIQIYGVATQVPAAHMAVQYKGLYVWVYCPWSFAYRIKYALAVCRLEHLEPLINCRISCDVEIHSTPRH